MQPVHQPRYTVQILLPGVVRLDPVRLHRQLSAWRADIELAHARGGDRFNLRIPTDDHPLHINIFNAPLDSYAESLCDALTWSPAWRWDDIAGRCHASLVVSMTALRPVNHASKLLAFLAVLDAVLFSLADDDRDAAILHWLPAQQLLTFERYCLLRTELGPCGPAVNIRIANATGRPGELLADTLGLTELGLPDLQLVFSDRDPAEVMQQLHQLVRSMFVGDHLDCGWIEEASLVPPLRDALTLQLD